jgi:hypothetical protein
VSDGEPVVFCFDNERIDIAQAIIGETPIGFDFGQGGMLQSWQTTDFLIAREDLVLFGREVVPEPGMRIFRTIRGQTVPFEVRPVEDGRCYRNSDAVTREMLRIHTKEIVGTETVEE